MLVTRPTGFLRSGPRLGPRSLSASRLSRTGQRARRPAGASAEPSRKPPSPAADACLSERNYIALGSASAPLADLMIAPMASFGIYELYRQMAEEQSVRESARIAAPAIVLPPAKSKRAA
jgi:hypothetical protein